MALLIDYIDVVTILEENTEIVETGDGPVILEFGAAGDVAVVDVSSLQLIDVPEVETVFIEYGDAIDIIDVGTIEIVGGGGGEPGTGGHIIEDEANVEYAARARLQFIGATVADDEPGDRTVVTITPGGGGGGGGPTAGYWAPMSNGIVADPALIFSPVTGEVIMIWVEA